MVSERVGDGSSHGGNVFSRRGAACAEFSQSILSMLPPFGRVGVGRCVSNSKSDCLGGGCMLCFKLSKLPPLWEGGG